MTKQVNKQDSIFDTDKSYNKAPVSEYLEVFLGDFTLSADGFNTDFDFTTRYDPVPEPSYAKCDWLRATQTDKDKFVSFCARAFPYFKDNGFTIRHDSKGMHGYTDVFAIEMYGERVGCFAAAEQMGGLFELTGYGCDLMLANWAEWQKMIWALNCSQFELTRLDIAVDLRGNAWYNYGQTVPKMLVMTEEDGFLRVGAGQGSAPAISQNGHWAGFTSGRLTSSTYKAFDHSPEGLSYNVGKRNGVNSFCVYEKGKEQASKGGIEKLDAVTASWVRIERRYTRGQGRSKSTINWDMAVLCDRALVWRCPTLEKFITDFFDWRGRHGMNPPQSGEVSGLVRVQQAVKRKILQKAFWASRHAGRCVNTLKGLGYTAVEIVEMLSNPDGKGVQGYIDNMTHKDDITHEFALIRRSYSTV